MNLYNKIQKISGDSIMIPDSVWDCEDLKPIDIKVYRLLLKYSRFIFSSDKGKITQDGEPIITVSQKTIYMNLKINSATLDSSLKRLESVKLIHVDRYNGFKKNNNILVLGDFFDFSKIEESREASETPKIKIKGEVYNLSTKKNKPINEPKLTKSETVKKTKPKSTKPIKRVPIKLADSPKQRYLEKLRSIGGKTWQEKEILTLAKHYEMLVRKMNHTSGYRSLSLNNPQEHKNWEKFKKVLNLCKENRWEPSYYLDAQFDKAEKYWTKCKFKFPLPQMLCSKASQEYFERWAKERAEIFAEDVYIKEKLKSQKTLTLRQQVIRDIVRSTELLSMYCTSGTEEERQQGKALKIYDTWGSYSSAYLYSVSWFKDFVKELEQNGVENPRLEMIKKDFSMYDKNKKIQKVIEKTVEMAELEFEIPANIAI